MNNRILLKYHSLTGLVVGVFLVLMGLSGAILVFQHDIEDQLWEPYSTISDYQGMHIDRGIRTIQQRYPKWDTRLIHFQENEALIFNLRRPTGRLFVFVHPSSGEILKEINELTTFTRWLLKFHYSFQAGVFGRILVFLMGLLFLASLLTGFVLYRKSILKTLLFKTRVVRKNTRSFYSSLHRIVGVWSLILNLLLGITGTFLAWTVAASGLNPPAFPQTPIVTASTEAVLEQVNQQYPDFQPTYVRLPLQASASLVVYGFFDEDPFYYSEFYNSIQADPGTGAITGITRVQEAPLKTKLTSTLLPLHFGQYGGLWTKVLYCLTGLSGPFLSISGFVIWRIRKKKQKRSTK